MDILSLLSALEKLERENLASPKHLISTLGKQKVTELINLYNKGLEYGLAPSELKDLFQQALPSTEKEIISPAREAITPVSEEPPVQDEVEEVPAPQKARVIEFFLNKKDVHHALLALSSEGVLEITTTQICELAEVEATKGTLRKITSVLDELGYPSKLVNDPTRLTRTRSRMYSINLKTLDDRIDEIWAYLEERRLHTRLKMPISIYDYLDGTEQGFMLRSEGESLSLVLQAHDYNHFSRVLSNLYKQAYGDSPTGNSLENNGLNRFLLSRAMFVAFPPITAQELVRGQLQLGAQHYEATRTYLRQALSKIEVSQSLFDDEWASLDTTLSGFVYLLASMKLDYYTSNIL